MVCNLLLFFLRLLRALVLLTSHATRFVALGFSLMEERKRLRPEYAALGEREIAELARRVPRDQLTEVYEKILLAYSGDSMPLEPDTVRGAEVLMHEATFLEPDDRETPTHATLEEALRVAVAAGVRALGLFHVSSRYPGRRVRRRVQELAAELAPDLPIVLFRSGRKLWLSPAKSEEEG